jgi:alkylated DNA repair dioxygenase AlkB
LSTPQLSLFRPRQALPGGFVYQEDLISLDQERGLIENFPDLDFKEFEFHGYRGKRRVVSFGLHYDFAGAKLRAATEMPSFLLPIRELAAGLAGLSALTLCHALVTEYQPGAGIGWHRDRSVFGEIIGISLGSECRLRFRRTVGDEWERMSANLKPRSAYLLRGAARTAWEHSILPMVTLRYSVTFRTVVASVLP